MMIDAATSMSALLGQAIECKPLLFGTKEALTDRAKVTDMRRRLVLPSVCMLCADDGPGAGGRRTEAIAQIWIKMANDVIQKQYGNRRLVSLGL